MKFAGLVVVLMCVAAACAAQDEDSAAKSTIAALDEAWNKAYRLGDAKSLDTILDEDVVLVKDDGRILGKAEFMASLKTASSQERQVSPESMNIHLFGTSAIATGIMRVKAVEKGKSYARQERFIDTWVSKGGRWVCVATAATPVFQ